MFYVKKLNQIAMITEKKFKQLILIHINPKIMEIGKNLLILEKKCGRWLIQFLINDCTELYLWQ